MSATEYVALAAALGTAAEATGATNFTSLGPSEQQGQRPAMPQLPSGGGLDPSVVVDAVRAARADSGRSGGVDPTDLARSLSEAVQAGVQAGGAAAGAPGEARTVLNVYQQGKDAVENAREQVEETTTSATTPSGSRRSSSRDRSSSEGSRYGSNLQDYADKREGIQAGDAVAIAGETAKAAGDGVTAAGKGTKDGVMFIRNGANTLVQSAKALAGREVDVRNTYVEDMNPDMEQNPRRRLYKGSLNPFADNNAYGFDGSSKKKSGRGIDVLGVHVPDSRDAPAVEKLKGWL